VFQNISQCKYRRQAIETNRAADQLMLKHFIVEQETRIRKTKVAARSSQLICSSWNWRNRSLFVL